MEEVIRLFKQIQKTSGLNEKKEIITKNKDNDLFKECLKFLLDGNVTTGIAEKKYDSITAQTSDWIHNNVDSEFLELLNYIKQHNTGREEDVIQVQAWCCTMSAEVKNFVRGMITKSIKLGADAKLVNKCIPGLIPTFDVMLGTPIDKVKLKGDEWISISRKLNGCFDGNTYITMSDNTKKKIKDIVIGDEVLSFNENTKKISKQKVINVFDNGLKDRSEWMQIETAVERGNLRDFIQVTKNHKIFTPDGWKEAGTLHEGDIIYIRDYELSDVQKSVLLGIGLGDASVMFDNPEIKTVRFNYPKKIDYYSDFLHSVCDLFDIYTGSYSKKTSGYGSKMENGSIKTIYNIPRYFTNQNNVVRMSYTFTDEILTHITPLALAIYYIDDGSKLPCKDDGNKYAINKHPRVVLATHRHNKEDVERFSRYLYERYLITNRIAKYETCYEDGGYQIELDMEGTYKFFDLIAKYIPYNIRDQKLSKYWHNIPYEDWTKCYGEYKLIERKIEKIILSEELKFNHSSERKSNRAYDIEVENNHTYFANGYAVHNCRCAFVGDKCMTRQGKEYKGLDHIVKDLHSLGLKNCFVDGELLYKNEEGLSDSEAFQKGTGIAMSKDEDKSNLKLVIFDVFPLEEFWGGKSKESYYERKQTLLEIREDIDLFEEVENVEVVQMCYEGTDHSQIWKWLNYAEENDWEGIMLNLDTPYECKRTKNLIKVKKFFSCDIKCTGIEEGSGRNKGMLGALICDYKGNKVNVGSGFSDEDRKQIWQHPEDVIDKIITVKYKEETKNKDGGVSIQFPVFEGVRFDKKEPSYD